MHLGVHNHPVAQGKCRETVDIMKKLVREEVQRSPLGKVMPSDIMGPQGQTFEKFDTKGHANFMSRFKTITSPNVRNHVAFCKFQFAHKGSIDRILNLKAHQQGQLHSR